MEQPSHLKKHMEENKELSSLLIVDDDPTTRMFLRATISQWGLSIIEANNGLEAIDKLQAPNPPRIVLVDWMMPELDGIGFCQKVKTEFQRPPYIILATNFTGAMQVVKALDAGADEFLTKPYNSAELRSRLRAGMRILSYENKKQPSVESTNKVFFERNIVGEMVATNKQLSESMDNFLHEFSTLSLQNNQDYTNLLEKLKTIITLKETLSKSIQALDK